VRYSLPILLGLSLAVALGACQAHRVSSVPRPPPRADLPPYAYYEAGGEIPEPTSIELERVTPGYEIRRILLPPRVPPELADYGHAKDPIEIVHYRPRPLGGTPRPLVLISPILGNDMTLMPEFASGITGLGYHAAVVVRKDFAFEPETALDDAEKEFRVLVMRNRQAFDYFAALEEVDGSRLGTLGVSAGAIISACLAGADPRPKAHVLVFAGGPLADVLTTTSEDRFHKYAEGVREAKGLTDAEITQALRDAMRTDPVKLAPRVRREDVLLFVAKNDTSVPTQTGHNLWCALGRPELRLLPWGHYASFALQAYMQTEANRFLRARLGPP
jgi:dienelactone hydrolase